MATISAKLLRLAGLLVFLLAFLPGIAQDDPTRTTSSLDLPNRADREIDFANLLFQEGQYLRALPVYDSLLQVYPDKLPIQYLDGICHIYKKTGRTRAIELLREIPRDQFREIDFYLGRAYHLAYEFDKATVAFERYLSERRPTGSRRTETNRYLRNCVIGKDLMLRATDVKIELLEPPSKQISSQYAPMVTGNEQLMVYTNRGPENVGDLKNDAGRNRPEGDYYEDLFYARFVNGRWSLGEPLSDSINTGGHEASAAISSDGKRLFIYRS
ncbi:MAG: tetratricopeptide repeat protein, partial [Bacteroidota bacterium]